MYQQQRLVAATTPASVIYKQSLTPVNITPRPLTTETPATTYRPQLLQVAVTPRPSLLYTKQISANPRPAFLGSTPSPLFTRGNLDFDAEFQKFQQENNVVSPTPSPALSKTTPRVVKPAPAPGTPGNGPIYSSELVFDPASGQYNTQLYQTLPQTQGDFTLNHRIQPYVQAPNSIVNLQQLQQRSPLYNGYRTISPQASQAVYQQQLIQKSANLFEAQQKAQHQQQQQSPVRPQPDGTPQQQQFYYIQPTSFQQPQGLVGGQIDAFLRGHNIQF